MNGDFFFFIRLENLPKMWINTRQLDNVTRRKFNNISSYVYYFWNLDVKIHKKIDRLIESF